MFSGSAVGPENLRTYQAPRGGCCCWSVDLTLSSAAVDSLEFPALKTVVPFRAIAGNSVGETGHSYRDSVEGWVHVHSPTVELLGIVVEL